MVEADRAWKVTGSVGCDLLRGIQRICLADLQNVLCADGKGVAAGTVRRGDQHGNVLIALGIGGTCQSKDAGELDAQIVPVADLVADLDFDGRVIAGLAAAQHSSSAPRAATEAPVTLRKVRREILFDIKLASLINGRNLFLR